MSLIGLSGSTPTGIVAGSFEHSGEQDVSGQVIGEFYRLPIFLATKERELNDKQNPYERSQNNPAPIVTPRMEILAKEIDDGLSVVDYAIDLSDPNLKCRGREIYGETK